MLLAMASTAFATGQRINQEGRILGPAPTVTQPILFDTAGADAVVSAMQIMPVTNPWNENVSQLPLLANSAAMIAQIQADLAFSRQTLRPFYEMNYVLVPDNQPVVPIDFFNYPDESDLNGGNSPYGLYPIPANQPVEGWPVETGTLTITQWQEDVNQTGGDRHAIMVQPVAGYTFETWEALVVSGSWQASNGAIFNLNSNALRPEGWTSGDAAGLPMFPAVVRYDECERGMVEHAVRLVVYRTRVGPIYPATHQASVGNTTNPNIPAMGQRLRLKASFVIPSTWTIEEKAVCLGLKKYGGLVADNGGFFSFSVCPDDRFSPDAFDDLSTIPISDFEVVQSTGTNGGSRSSGAPVASAGSDQYVPYGATVSLQGAMTAPSTMPVIQWYMYSGPGTVTFGNAAQPVTTATFSLPGTYTLMLSGSDGVHAVAYDAVNIHVSLAAKPSSSGNNFTVSFPSLTGHVYRVQWAANPASGAWTTLQDNISGTGGTIQVTDTNALSQAQRFYQVLVLQ